MHLSFKNLKMGVFTQPSEIQPHLFHPTPTPFLPKFWNFNQPIYEEWVIICDTIIKHLHSTGFLEIINWIKFDLLTHVNLPLYVLFITLFSRIPDWTVCYINYHHHKLLLDGKKTKLKRRKKWNQNKFHYFEKLRHKDFRIDMISRYVCPYAIDNQSAACLLQR